MKLNGAKKALSLQRKIQRETDRRDARKPNTVTKKAAVQAGARKQPENPLPAQHLAKPGLESDLHPAPRFEAKDYRRSGKLRGSVALVTGGDSGIGRAVAVLFAREGADVAIVYLCEHEDAKTTTAYVRKEGRKCVTLPGDVREATFRDAVERTVRELGKLDILVNNAAFQEHAQSIEELSDEQFDLTMRTNVYGYFNMAKAALPHLPRGGSIINTGSETGRAAGNGRPDGLENRAAEPGHAGEPIHRIASRPGARCIANLVSGKPWPAPSGVFSCTTTLK